MPATIQPHGVLLSGSSWLDAAPAAAPAATAAPFPDVVVVAVVVVGVVTVAVAVVVVVVVVVGVVTVLVAVGAVTVFVAVGAGVAAVCVRVGVVADVPVGAVRVVWEVTVPLATFAVPPQPLAAAARQTSTTNFDAALIPDERTRSAAAGHHPKRVTRGRAAPPESMPRARGSPPRRRSRPQQA